MNTNKKIKIICEEAYADSIWCKQLLSGLTKELKKRRIGYEQVSHADSLECEDSICIIGLSDIWTGHIIEKCNATGVVPVVLSSQSRRNLDGQYHLICPDMHGAVRALKEAFMHAGRMKIALYAANRVVDLDRDRTEVFSELVQDTSDIYSNKDSLENCFRSFLPKASLYDAVICVNGYAAVSLVKKLEKENKHLLEQLAIVTFEEVLKHSKYNRWISLVDLNLEAYGAVAMTVLEVLTQRSAVSAVTVEMKCQMCDLPQKSLENKFDEEGATVVRLFEDPEMIYMARIEQLMQDADDMDHHIIAMLLSNAKYSEIADTCYMTEGNVKYRVKKYMNICGCNTKKELLELLKEYLQ
ncbi:MAG: LacI family DNA-binding transcriptional regulator [Lachnospiraceae bacterium]|nr:LacI family DNA-binding transcriptional regulator [Lachnospiraceae bacterium]